MLLFLDALFKFNSISRYIGRYNKNIHQPFSEIKLRIT